VRSHIFPVTLEYISVFCSVTSCGGRKQQEAAEILVTSFKICDVGAIK